ncbi:MAG: hypothetical protein AAGG02_20405 [Cyanobacteria bacterium P01_H01_bin.15]
MKRLATPILLLLLGGLLFLCFQSMRYVTLREATLYQGFFPIEDRTSEFEVGNIVVANLLTGQIEAVLPGPCELSTASHPEVDVRRSTQSFNARSMIRFTEQDGSNMANQAELIFEVSTIDPISYLNSEFNANPECENDLRNIAHSYCLLVIKSLATLNGVMVGFDVSERCQIINSSLEPVTLDQLATASSFDGIFGVDVFERFWIDATRTIVGFSISVSSS